MPGLHFELLWNLDPWTEGAGEVEGTVLVYHKLAVALHLITDNLISLPTCRAAKIFLLYLCKIWAWHAIVSKRKISAEVNVSTVFSKAFRRLKFMDVAEEGDRLCLSSLELRDRTWASLFPKIIPVQDRLGLDVLCWVIYWPESD